MPALARGPFYGLTQQEIDDAALELTADVRLAVAGIDASHIAEDDVNADACGAMRKTLARVCRATSFFWEVEPVDHRARAEREGIPVTTVGETHTGADIGFLLYDSASERNKVALVQAKRLDMLVSDKRVWSSLVKSCETLDAGIAVPGGWAWIYQLPPKYETTAFSATVVRSHKSGADPVDALVTGDEGHALQVWFVSLLTCHYGSLKTQGHIRTWVQSHRPRRMLVVAPDDREGDVGLLREVMSEAGYRESTNQRRDRNERG